MSPEQDRSTSAHFSNWNVLWKNDADETSADSHLTPGSLLRAEKCELLIKTLKSSEIITEGFFFSMTYRSIIVSTIFLLKLRSFTISNKYLLWCPWNKCPWAGNRVYQANKPLILKRQRHHLRDSWFDSGWELNFFPTGHSFIQPPLPKSSILQVYFIKYTYVKFMYICNM